MPNNKSPGLDGLSNEFYQAVFPLIKNKYLAVKNWYQQEGKVSNEIRKEVTRLLPKTACVPTVEKVRPIKMLIPDYSIKSRLLTNRLSGVMEDESKHSNWSSQYSIHYRIC